MATDKTIDVKVLTKTSNGEFVKITQLADAAVLGAESVLQLKMIHEKANEDIIIRNLENNSMTLRKRVMFSDEEESKYEEFDARIEDLKSVYGESAENLLNILDKTSGNVYDLERHLKGKQVVMWTALEDMALRQPSSNDMHKFLLKSKGRSALLKRKRYLQIKQ